MLPRYTLPFLRRLVHSTQPAIALLLCLRGIRVYLAQLMQVERLQSVAELVSMQEVPLVRLVFKEAGPVEVMEVATHSPVLLVMSQVALLADPAASEAFRMEAPSPLKKAAERVVQAELQAVAVVVPRSLLLLKKLPLM
jgi:hypothetical protein